MRLLGTLRSGLYRLYDRRIVRNLGPGEPVPRHVGVITDGNRRWAKEFGTSTAHGHRMGAGRILDLLDWCEEIGVEVVTLYVLSKENLARPAAEVNGMDAAQAFQLVHVRPETLTHTVVPVVDAPTDDYFSEEWIARMAALTPEERLDCDDRARRLVAASGGFN